MSGIDEVVTGLVTEIVNLRSALRANTSAINLLTEAVKEIKLEPTPAKPKKPEIAPPQIVKDDLVRLQNKLKNLVQRYATSLYLEDENGTTKAMELVVANLQEVCGCGRLDQVEKKDYVKLEKFIDARIEEYA